MNANNKTNILYYDMFNKHRFESVNVEADVSRPLLASKSLWQLRHLSTDGIRP
jgi:hypothetical protein